MNPLQGKGIGLSLVRIGLSVSQGATPAQEKQGFYIMERLTLNVSDTDSLKRTATDLLASNESFYRLALELANSTDSDAGQIEPDDIAKFAEYLNEGTTYYTAELLYMAQFAMNDVVAE